MIIEVFAQLMKEKAFNVFGPGAVSLIQRIGKREPVKNLSSINNYQNLSGFTVKIAGKVVYLIT